MGGTTNLKVGGGQCNGRVEVNLVKTLTFEKGGVHDHPSSYGGAALL